MFMVKNELLESSLPCDDTEVLLWLMETSSTLSQQLQCFILDLHGGSLIVVVTLFLSTWSRLPQLSMWLRVILYPVRVRKSSMDDLSS